LNWAKGIVPHIKGLVTVDWKIVGDQLFINYSTPEKVPVIVKPRGKLAKYSLIINK